MSPMRVLVYRRDGVWFAQGLEHDILVHAETLAGVRRAFERALTANLAVNEDLGRTGLDGIPPAPAEAFSMFEAAAASPIPLDPGTDPIREMRIAA